MNEIKIDEMYCKDIQGGLFFKVVDFRNDLVLVRLCYANNYPNVDTKDYRETNKVIKICKKESLFNKENKL